MNSGLVLVLSDGRTWPINAVVQIGRERTCQIALNDAQASRLHATVWMQQGILYVRDENSMNGTYVNGARIPGGQPVMLRPGDQMHVGGTGFQVRWAAAPVAPPPVWPAAPQKKGGFAWPLILAGLGLMAALICVCAAAGWYISQSSSNSVSSVAPELASFGKLASVASKPVTATVSQSPSTVQLDEGVSIQIPAGAFAKPTQLETTHVNVALDQIAFDVKEAQFYVVSTRDEVGALGAPVVLEVAKPTSSVTVVQFDGVKWQPVKVKAGQTTRVEITHFSKGMFGFLEWWSERSEQLGQEIDTDAGGPLARERQKIENSDQWVRGFYGAGERATQSQADMCNEITSMLARYNVKPNRDFPRDSSWRNQEMARFLHAAASPSGYGGYHNDLTSGSMDEIRRRVVASSGSVSPAEFLRISIEANGGNVPLGVLAAHNYLKEITYRGRDSFDSGHGMPQELGEPASRLQSWRQDSNVTPAGFYDKMGPLYHIFAAMTAGLWLPTSYSGDTVAAGEAFLRTFRIGADRADTQKAEADQCGVQVAQWLRDRPPAEPPAAVQKPAKPTATKPGASQKYAVFLLTNVSGGSIWVGQEADIKDRKICSYPGGGLCKGDGTDAKVEYQKKSADFATYDEAVKAYCGALQSPPKSMPLTGGAKAKIYGSEYWVDTAPGCPEKK